MNYTIKEAKNPVKPRVLGCFTQLNYTIFFSAFGYSISRFDISQSNCFQVMDLHLYDVPKQSLILKPSYFSSFLVKLKIPNTKIKLCTMNNIHLISVLPRLMLYSFQKEDSHYTFFHYKNFYPEFDQDCILVFRLNLFVQIHPTFFL